MRIFNKVAKRNYYLFNRFEAGVILTGGEAKAALNGHLDLSRSFARVIDGQLCLVNAVIPLGAVKDYDPAATRKLLLHKHELVSVIGKMKQKKLTLVPVSMYNKGRLVKVELALAKTKRLFERKEILKKKDIEKDLERELKLR